MKNTSSRKKAEVTEKIENEIQKTVVTLVENLDSVLFENSISFGFLIL